MAKKTLTEQKAEELAAVLHEDLSIVKVNTKERHIFVNFKYGCPECDGYASEVDLLIVVCNGFFKFVWSNRPDGRSRPIRWTYATHHLIENVAADIHKALLNKARSEYARLREKAVYDYVIDNMVKAGFERVNDNRFALKTARGWSYTVNLDANRGVIKIGRGWSTDKIFPLAKPTIEKEIERWVFNDVRVHVLTDIIEEGIEDMEKLDDDLVQRVASISTNKKALEILEIATGKLKGGMDAS